MKLAVDRIVISKDNPRQSFDEEGLRRLGESIKTHGQLQPIIVRAKGSMYELVVGERRLRACALVGINEIEVDIRELGDATSMELRLIENCQREDLTDAEKGDAVLALWAMGKYETIKEIASKISFGEKTVQAWVRKASKLSDKVKKSVENSSLPEDAAYRLLTYPHSVQEKLANAIIKYNIRGGKSGEHPYRDFLKLYDQNPNANLEELANKAKGIETVTAPKNELPKELLEKIEEKKQLAKVRRVRKKPSKPITKEEVKKKLKKADFKFEKVKVIHGTGKATTLSPVIKPNILGTITPETSKPDWTLCKCSLCPLLGKYCTGRGS